MQTKALNILHVYIDADYKEHELSSLRLYCTSAGTHLLSLQMFIT